MTPSPVATRPAPARPSVARVPVPPLVQVLDLAEPLPGFPGHRDYVLVPADGGGHLFWLQSVAPDGPRFLAVSAASFFPDYAPALPGAACTELGMAAAEDASLYCLVTVPDGDVTAATANLRAPLVVNPDNQRARQLVLTDGVHPIRRPLRR
ncbi:flagellar assembly protein FliW [Blastococcus sp. CT_GayMR16]|uniref:flagellar assembly protein FliW n=1 Tax=Blastococcus sp. CT_GayMR16 TaxID=2559607 RepID=UPI0010733E31|nr:flagellar assembly protein FliW [Blastococcus sp. CT_GayMR16]TFV83310.1 flagellar assembly protein FliW [Blastococcus sp. CT_GayMR16]